VDTVSDLDFKPETLNALYPVMEKFYTIQGEGHNTGKAAFFIRLGGCDVECVWCDVKDSWNASAHPLMSVEQLLDEAQQHPGKNIVITGGEPAMHNLQALTNAFKQKGFQLWLETSGAHPITGSFDWVCLSPKKFKAPLTENFKLAHELKVVVYNKSDFKWAEVNAEYTLPSCRLFLQPEHSKFDEMTPLIVEYVKQNPRWQISLQVHKVINVP
jgi:organic radical activating enzyme